MILVIGDLTVRADAMDDALALSREHVARSRTEPGCISHDVHVHVDDANRLVFVERWVDRAALDTHFAVPESQSFARAVAALATERPAVRIYPIAPRDP